MTKLSWGLPRLGPLTPDQCAILQRSLNSWMGTRYKLYGQAPGPKGGVDCVRFVTAQGDELLDCVTAIPKTLSDISFSSPEGARATMRSLMELYDMRSVEGGILFPMDIIICGPKGGGPGHAMVAGTDGYIYHCTPASGVVRTGLDLQGQDFHAILRRKGGW